MNLEELKQEYATQDNRATAYPIYVTVQELICIGVVAEGYSPNCPYGDGEVKIEKNEEGEKKCMGYIWHPVEFFLTIKGAKEYMKCNAHNHGKLRTYVHHMERRNFEMREFFQELGFKTSD